MCGSGQVSLIHHARDVLLQSARSGSNAEAVGAAFREGGMSAEQGAAVESIWRKEQEKVGLHTRPDATLATGRMHLSAFGAGDCMSALTFACCVCAVLC